MHVVRAFEDPELPHAGGVDPARDVENLELELILADHDLIERRLERLAQSAKRGLKPEEERERELLADGRAAGARGASGRCARSSLAEDDERRLRGFQMLSAKPMLLVAQHRGGAGGARRAPEDVGIAPRSGRRGWSWSSAPIEAEISRLEPPSSRSSSPSSASRSRASTASSAAAITCSGVISFFTAGEDEVRAWTIRQGTRAREAAGTIHSDIERGFIRAEVVGWEDLVRLGSLARCRSEGVLRLEGKEYEVHDGEVVHFRFAV